MTEGLIVSNKVHRAIFIEVMAGQTDAAQIAKRTRIVKPVAERAIEDLVRGGVITREGTSVKLSPEGERLAYELKRREFLS